MANVRTLESSGILFVAVGMIGLKMPAFSNCHSSDFCLRITGNVVWSESAGLWYNISYVN